MITGICALPNAGSVIVHNGLTIASTGDLDGGKLGRLTVYGNITVNKGGTLLLGCSADSGCGGVTNHRVTQSINFRNKTGGNVVVRDNVSADPDATEIAGNRIGQSLSCCRTRRLRSAVTPASRRTRSGATSSGSAPRSDRRFHADRRAVIGVSIAS